MKKNIFLLLILLLISSCATRTYLKETDLPANEYHYLNKIQYAFLDSNSLLNICVTGILFRRDKSEFRIEIPIEVIDAPEKYLKSGLISEAFYGIDFYHFLTNSVKQHCDSNSKAEKVPVITKNLDLDFNPNKESYSHYLETLASKSSAGVSVYVLTTEKNKNDAIQCGLFVNCLDNMKHEVPTLFLVSKSESGTNTLQLIGGHTGNSHETSTGILTANIAFDIITSPIQVVVFAVLGIYYLIDN